MPTLRHILLLLFLSGGMLLHAQKQNNQWRFGFRGAGHFNGTRVAALPPSRIQSVRSCIVAADRTTGALLFYSDGITMWDATDTPMPNGTGLAGSRSSTQGGQVVPRPGHPNQYYVFIVGTATQGLSYSLVDMGLRGGLGDVDPAVKNVRLIRNTTGRIQSVPTCDRQGYWVLVPDRDATMNAFLVTETGVDPNPVQSESGVAPFGDGQLKINRRYDRLAFCDTRAAYVYDFNSNTGVADASNQLAIFGPEITGGGGPRAPKPSQEIGGVEFSPNGRLLYLSKGPALLQINLGLNGNPAINASGVELIRAKGIFSVYTSLQLAADGRIYEAYFTTSVNNPNVRGTGAVAQRRTALYSDGGEGLPNWIFDNSEGKITAADTCAGSTSHFTITDTIQVTNVDWDFGDPASGSNNTGTGITGTHVYAQPGTYTVQATIYRSCGASQVLLRTVTTADCCSMPNSPYVDFRYGAETVCSNFGSVAPVKGSGFAPGGVFSSTTGLSLNAATGVITAPGSTAGAYVVDYTVQPPACPAPLHGTARIEIRPSPAPPAVVSPVTLCQNTVPPAFRVSGSNLRWYEDPTDTTSSAVAPRIDSSEAGSYSVYVAEAGANGCVSDRVPITVSVWALPEVNAGGPILRINVGESLTLPGQATAGSTLLWQPGGMVSARPVVMPVRRTQYTLTATSAEGCSNSDSVDVFVQFVLKVPNVFTPNGDGVNDTWVIRYLDTYPDLKLDIFDRWGRAVHSWRNGMPFWDGTTKGKPLPTGTYYWVIDAGPDVAIQKGFVDLVR